MQSFLHIIWLKQDNANPPRNHMIVLLLTHTAFQFYTIFKYKRMQCCSCKAISDVLNQAIIVRIIWVIWVAKVREKLTAVNRFGNTDRWTAVWCWRIKMITRHERMWSGWTRGWHWTWWCGTYAIRCWNNSSKLAFIWERIIQWHTGRMIFSC